MFNLTRNNHRKIMAELFIMFNNLQITSKNRLLNQVQYYVSIYDSASVNTLDYTYMMIEINELERQTTGIIAKLRIWML
ncbi:unnamed protein product [Adineta ricciae]|uniref:Uncharacterized protein n=1 Tax=Adineta ricciae TaxID=249248 RepID=A0A813Q8L2_ADIRI|nr:unnamed protein product [Adineta ricciae]